MSILHRLIRARDQDGRLQTFRDRLAAGEDPNAESSQGTPLFLLAFNNVTNPQDEEVHLQMARELIIFGADVNVQDGLGWTPLIVAVIVRNLRMVEFLLDVNAEVNLRDNNGNTALHHAVESGRFQISERNDVVTYNKKIHIVKTLIRFNSELERVNNLNQTPLMLAVKDKDYLIMKQLLKNYASPEVKDMYGDSLMHYALGRTNVSLNIVSELMRHIPFSTRNRYGDYPMSVYVKHLSNASPDELEKAKYVFKVFLLDENEFTDAEMAKIYEISRDTNCNLFNYCDCCYKEIAGMKGDKLAKKCSVYTLAMSAIYCRNIKDEPSMFDKVLDKLFKGKYPVYCDLIVSGISRKYLNKEFVETCCSVEITGIGFLSNDTLCSLTSYLSNVDMFNMMRACCPDKRWSKSSHCSIM
ncbi:putative ankyrin repeat protein FPV228 like protein [Argiope bruennichi]|uniref:Putative ankyrin repeat protein FPV228 like protein n=1 Tax=Argiope bruennichi TaxID=94029 RepID=A0A8T0EKX9_ARGBR|nr:putative ankyrin repeat protein FPV228 like protein [Argiope bruennichi]